MDILTTPCILSTYTYKIGGYARVRIGAKLYLHHRLAYCKAHGLDIDAIKGQVIMHTCDVRDCVNPAHLVLGTKELNNLDRDSKNRQSKGQGHGSTKLTDMQVIQIREAYATGLRSMRELAKLHGVSKGTIQSLVTRLTWKHL